MGNREFNARARGWSCAALRPTHVASRARVVRKRGEGEEHAGPVHARIINYTARHTVAAAERTFALSGVLRPGPPRVRPSAALACFIICRANVSTMRVVQGVRIHRIALARASSSTLGASLEFLMD